MASSSREPVRVLVTGVGGGGHGHEILKALRLAATRYSIVGTDIGPVSYGLYDSDAHHVVPFASDPEYVDHLIEICRKHGIQVLVTGSEPELRAVSARRDLFAGAGLLVLANEARVVDVCMNKFTTMRFLSERGFRIPATVLLETDDDCRRVERLPVVLKPAVGGGGSQHVFVAQDHEELRLLTRYLRKQGCLPLAQEYVGTAKDEYTVGVLTTLDGVLVGSLAVHRHIMSGLSSRTKIPKRMAGAGDDVLVVSSGISQGAIEDAPTIRKSCEEMAMALGSKGPMNFQVRVADGQVYPFEVNPRFSGTTGFRALAGYNEPDILIRHHLFGEPLAPVSYRRGLVLRALADRLVEEGPGVDL